MHSRGQRKRSSGVRVSLTETSREGAHKREADKVTCQVDSTQPVCSDAQYSEVEGVVILSSSYPFQKEGEEEDEVDGYVFLSRRRVSGEAKRPPQSKTRGDD